MNIKNNNKSISEKFKEEDRQFKDGNYKIQIKKIKKMDPMMLIHSEIQKTLKKSMNFKILLIQK
jgi:hypothetical protein